MRKVRFHVALLLTLVMLALVGCGGKKTNTPASSPEAKAPAGATTAPAVAKEFPKVKIPIGGATSSIIYLPPVLSAHAGFYKAEGLDVEVYGTKSGADAAQALVSGEADFASLAVEHAVKSKAQGVDLVMLALYTRFPAVTLIVDSKHKDKIKTIADLKGHRVGVTSPGSGTHKVMLSLMDKFGLQTSDVEILGVGTSGMPAAIQEGKVVAAVGLDPWVTEMVSSGKAYILWDLRTKKDTEALYGGEYPFVGLMTRQDVIDKNPELVAAVTRAVVKSNQLLATASAEEIASKLPAEVKGDNETLYIASLRSNLEAYSPNGIASDKGLQIVIDSLIKDKVIPESSNIKPSMVFNSFWSK